MFKKGEYAIKMKLIPHPYKQELTNLLEMKKYNGWENRRSTLLVSMRGRYNKIKDIYHQQDMGVELLRFIKYAELELAKKK